MNYGLDIDGTITEMPELFALLTRVLRAAGHKVHIVTYRDPASAEETKNELKTHKVVYDKLHLPDDKGIGMGNWKHDVAEQEKLDIMIDDSLEVLAAMPNRVLRFWVVPEDVLRE